MPNPTTIPHCPCGRQAHYTDCCQRYHNGAIASTPEALMRSRFTAFVLKHEDYLRTSWHPSTCPPELNLDSSPDWVSLRIIDSSEEGNSGQVHFQAVYRLNPGWGYLQEHSQFVRESGRWYYLLGEPREGILKPGRNESCPCGSGKKFKVCCC